MSEALRVLLMHISALRTDLQTRSISCARARLMMSEVLVATTSCFAGSMPPLTVVCRPLTEAVASATPQP